jgi:hypothetical protein
MGQLEVNNKLSHVVISAGLYTLPLQRDDVHKCVMQMQLRMFCKQVGIFVAGSCSGMHFMFMGPQ